MAKHHFVDAHVIEDESGPHLVAYVMITSEFAPDEIDDLKKALCAMVDIIAQRNPPGPEPGHTLHHVSPN
jgi:hypothetical protein